MHVDQQDLGADGFVGELVAHDNDLVSDGSKSCGGSVECDDSAASLAGEDVGLEAGTGLDDSDSDLLSDQHACFVDEICIDSDASLIVESRFRHGRPVDLAPEHPTHDCPHPCIGYKVNPLREFEVGEELASRTEFESVSRPRQGLMIGRYTTGTAESPY